MNGICDKYILLCFNLPKQKKKNNHNSVSMNFQKRKTNIERVLDWSEERKMSMCCCSLRHCIRNTHRAALTSFISCNAKEQKHKH